jgi:hypothetical protein
LERISVIRVVAAVGHNLALCRRLSRLIPEGEMMVTRTSRSLH